MSTAEKKADEVKTISETTRGHANGIKKVMEFDKESGHGVVAKDYYIENLPEGLTAELVKSKAIYDAGFSAAVAVALQEKALESKSKADEFTARAHMVGSDHLDLTIRPTAETRNPGTGEKMTTYGQLSVSMSTHTTNKGAGELKLAKAQITEAFRAAMKA